MEETESGGGDEGGDEEGDGVGGTGADPHSPSLQSLGWCPGECYRGVG